MDTLNISLDDLTTVQNVNPRNTQPYDMRFSEKTKKFRLSDMAFTRLGIDARYLKMHVHPQGYVLLSSHPETGEESGKGTFMTRRGDFNKGQEFTNRKLRRELDAHGFEGVNDFTLSPLGDKEGVPYFVVAGYDGDSDDFESPLLTYSMTGNTVEDEATAEEAEDIEEAIAEGSFEDSEDAADEADDSEDSDDDEDDEEDDEEAPAGSFEDDFGFDQ